MQETPIPAQADIATDKTDKTRKAKAGFIFGVNKAPGMNLDFLIATIEPACAAAYIIMGVSRPALPPGYNLVGAIHADMQAAASAMMLAGPIEQHIVHSMLGDSNVFGLVAWNAEEATALISIRGTQTIWDWISDIDVFPYKFIQHPASGLAHLGFQLLYEHIRCEIFAMLEDLHATRTLVTGHSLGGALAHLCALDLALNVLGPVPEVYTIAGPRAGDDELADATTKVIVEFHRVVNFFDFVPQVPLPPIYHHAGTELLVKGGFRPLDITYAHRLTTYLAGLNTLAKVHA